jgi:oxygen-independent coproporphyrinogen-3 oxidase
MSNPSQTAVNPDASPTNAAVLGHACAPSNTAPSPVAPAVAFDAALIEKYDRAIPRYTSYPPATQLTPDFDVNHLRQAIADGNVDHTPLSLYCHIPFCETPCYFCGCNTVITQRKEFAQPYLEALFTHIHRVADHINRDRPVNQMHWGGGTPNYLAIEDIKRLWNVLHDRFSFASDAEVSIEVNPRFLDRDYILALRELGFNRISFGIQDFDEQVQTAINRVQPEAMLFQVMNWMREAQFESVNVDLIYGLPYQTPETFAQTVNKTLDINPDRVAVFNFAYVPWIKPVQRRLPEDELPSPAQKLEIFHNTIDRLTQGGYTFIGMDHFAKPDDELAIAQRQGQLHRNFQGYTTKPESDLVSFGMTGISMLHDVYTQNQKRLQDYYRDIHAGEWAIERGVSLSQDDIIRRSVIMELMCQFSLTREALETKYNLQLNASLEEYFAAEQPELQALAADGLLELSNNHIQVTPVGRLLVRNIASVFDTYLRSRPNTGFSRSV